MVRGKRRQSESDVYHVIVRGEGRRILFEDDEDREVYLRLLASALANARTGVPGSAQGSGAGDAPANGAAPARLLAWCLMSNHVHLVLRAGFDELPRIMKSLNGGYAVYYNKRYGHVGHVFSGRYNSVPVEGDDQLLQVVRYVHLNPTKGGLGMPRDYRWSSYREYLSGSGLSDTSFVLEVCGGLERFVSYHELQGTAVAPTGPNAARRRLDDDEALFIARDLLGDAELRNLAACDREARDEAIALLRRAGLSARQVERFTGIGRGIIERVKWRR